MSKGDIALFPDRDLVDITYELNKDNSTVYTMMYMYENKETYFYTFRALNDSDAISFWGSETVLAMSNLFRGQQLLVKGMSKEDHIKKAVSLVYDNNEYDTLVEEKLMKLCISMTVMPGDPEQRVATFKELDELINEYHRPAWLAERVIYGSLLLKALPAPTEDWEPMCFCQEFNAIELANMVGDLLVEYDYEREDFMLHGPKFTGEDGMKVSLRYRKRSTLPVFLVGKGGEA